MNPCQYYSFSDDQAIGSINACSRASDKYPITLNCTGRTVVSSQFTTDNIDGREDYYLIFVEQGILNLYLAETHHTVGAGNIIIFPPRYHYRYSHTEEDTLSYLWAHFTGSYVESFLDECGFTALPSIYQTGREIKIISSFIKIFELFEAGGPLQNQRLSCAMEELIINAATAVRSDTGNRTLERSLRYIHSSYNREIRIPELAKMEMLSNSRYITVFKERTGLSPSEYLINLRMNAACDLLKNTKMSVKQVAVSVGYKDAHFFSRLFKRKTGNSPQEYAR